MARSYRNLAEYVAALEAAYKLVRVTVPINSIPFQKFTHEWAQ